MAEETKKTTIDDEETQSKTTVTETDSTESGNNTPDHEVTTTKIKKTVEQ